MGRITTTIFDALDRPTVVIDPMGGHTTTTYDGDGEVGQVGRPDGPDHDSRPTRSAAGWRPVTDPLGNITTYSYTATGQSLDASADPGTSGGGVPYPTSTTTTTG